MKDKPAQYKDIRDRFSNILSEGTISNYLEELIEEKQICKLREGNCVYYVPPKMSFSLKFLLITTAFCFGIFFPTLLIFNVMIMELIIFYIGVIFSTIILMNAPQTSTKKSMKPGIFNKK